MLLESTFRRSAETNTGPREVAKQKQSQKTLRAVAVLG